MSCETDCISTELLDFTSCEKKKQDKHAETTYKQSIHSILLTVINVRGKICIMFSHSDGFVGQWFFIGYKRPPSGLNLTTFMVSRPSVARFLEVFTYDMAQKRVRRMSREIEHRTDIFKVVWSIRE